MNGRVNGVPVAVMALLAFGLEAAAQTTSYWNNAAGGVQRSDVKGGYPFADGNGALVPVNVPRGTIVIFPGM